MRTISAIPLVLVKKKKKKGTVKMSLGGKIDKSQYIHVHIAVWYSHNQLHGLDEYLSCWGVDTKRIHTMYHSSKLKYTQNERVHILLTDIYTFTLVSKGGEIPSQEAFGIVEYSIFL